MTHELARRIAFTIGALLIFILGSHIPLPGVSTRFDQLFGQLSSGHIGRISIFTLTLAPYIAAATFIQLLSVVWGRLNTLQRSGEAGRRKLARITLMLTLLIASFLAFGVTSGLQTIPGVVAEPGAWFLLSAIASMVGGVFFMIWLSDQLTRHGIGNGIALLLSVQFLISLPSEVATALDSLRQGAVSANVELFNVLVWVALVALIVLVESARRNVPLEFAPRQLGTRPFPARASVLPIKLNSAGLMIPALVTPWVFSVPLALLAFFFGNDTPWIAAAYEHLQVGRATHLVLGSLVLFVVVFIYTAHVLDPDHAADVLQKRRGVIPGVEPGEPTARYFDRVVSLTTVVGAVYLVALSAIPEALVAFGMALSHKISGGGVLVVVCTILDLKMQVRDVSLTNSGGVRQ
jgi:preprotein translocase subunit SecY